MGDIVLEVKNISKSFMLHEGRQDSLKETVMQLFRPRRAGAHRFDVLQDISFELKRGEVLGIIGKNGAGKSTLLRILSGITPPDTGEINFYGKVVSILEIGAGFHPDLTGRENIYLVTALRKFSRQDVERNLQAIIDFSGVGKYIDEPVKNYSSGMYVRLAFSIISHLEADIYLIDEVISVGDADFQMKCKSKTEDLIAKGKTFLIVSHNLNEISVLCDRVLMLGQGKILEDGGNDVIQKYMSSALPAFAFNNDVFFHLREIKKEMAPREYTVIDYGLRGYKNVEQGISTNTPVKLYFELELHEDIGLDMSFNLYDSTGVLVFIFSTMKSAAAINTRGRYSIEFEIPANLLNQRMYWADLFFVKNKTTMLQVLYKFLTIKFADETLTQGYHHQMHLSCIVKPIIPVKVEKHA
jgi:lipopolysaccharide transport system ATP-binding protein